MPAEQRACEALAAAEQHRADGLAVRCSEIASSPGHPSAGSLPHYQEAYRSASETAAGHTGQPAGGAK